MRVNDAFTWRGEGLSLITLGTAQLGFDYGIANKSGQPSLDAAAQIINKALSLGVNFIDTAQGYGSSESVVGTCLARAPYSSALVISKIVPGEDPTRESLSRRVEESIARLGRPLWGLMVHGFKHWEANRRLFAECAASWKSEGLIRYFGVSVYSVEEARSLLAQESVDILQIPENLADGRMRRAGIFEEASRADKLCFVRSIYLQGLLTMPYAEACRKLPQSQEVLGKIQDLAGELGLSIKELALRYGIGLGAPLVIGADSASQLTETVELLNGKEPLGAEVMSAVDEIQMVSTEAVFNPMLWPQK